jgi:DNA-damage-inducible protein D
MSDIEIYNNEELSFEDFKNQNGIVFWWASELMLMLGYNSLKSFKPVIDRATKALISLGITHYENIMHTIREDNGQEDVKLTRFACYIIAMNADPKKKEVALVQAYFAQQTRKFELVIEGNDNIDRVLIREEIKEGHKSLFSTAKNSGVEDYAKFTNAGYRGMYNMMNIQLAERRNVDKDHLFDTMGRTELADNLFRMTQTEERIKSKRIKGQNALEQTHYDVGKEVREMVKKNSGKTPEMLPQEKELPSVKKELKQGFKEMSKLDKPKKK